MISFVAAEGPLRDRVLEARCQRPNNGLASRACGVLHAAQMKTSWGRQHQRTFALTDGHEILASAEETRNRHPLLGHGARRRNRRDVRTNPVRVDDRPVFLLVRWMIMNPDAPSDRPHTDAQPLEPPARRQAAYPADLAALVLTRWHEATAAGQIDLPPPATSALVDVLAICYQATLLREEGRPVTFRLARSEPDAFAPDAGPPSGLHRRHDGACGARRWALRATTA